MFISMEFLGIHVPGYFQQGKSETTQACIPWWYVLVYTQIYPLLIDLPILQRHPCALQVTSHMILFLLFGIDWWKFCFLNCILFWV
jgi:hypothetical protein